MLVNCYCCWCWLLNVLRLIMLVWNVDVKDVIVKNDDDNREDKWRGGGVEIQRTCSVSSREAFCTIFLMVCGMIWPWEAAMLDYLMNQQSKYEKSWVKLDWDWTWSFVLKIFPKTKPDADDDEQGWQYLFCFKKTDELMKYIYRIFTKSSMIFTHDKYKTS